MYPHIKTTFSTILKLYSEKSMNSIDRMQENAFDVIGKKPVTKLTTSQKINEMNKPHVQAHLWKS